MNATSDFLSPSESNPNGKSFPEIREDVPTQGEVFVHTDDVKMPSEEQLW